MEPMSVKPADFQPGDVVTRSRVTIGGYIRVRRTGVEWGVTTPEGDTESRLFLQDERYAIERPSREELEEVLVLRAQAEEAQRNRRLYQHALKAVRLRHGVTVRQLLGEELFKALVAQQILYLLAGQDESVSDERVRKLLDGAVDYLSGPMVVNG